MGKALAVLIVEDSETDTQLIARLLEKGGYDVDFRQVDDASQMAEALSQQPWDVVISDCHMPQFDAPAALRLLQETGLDIPFIVVSGSIGEEIAVAMMRAGAHDYVMKNNLSRLVPAVERELAQAEQRRNRKWVEEALRTSELQYRRLFETAKDGILILDAETGTISDANPYLLNLLGFSHDQLRGRRVWELGFLRDLVANQEMFEDLRRQEYVRYEDLPLEAADGRRIEVEFVSNVYSVDHLSVVQCNIRNISERKRAEKALQEVQERLQLAVDAGNVGLWDWDLRTDEVYYSPVWKRQIGYEDHEIGNRHLEWQDRVHPEDVDQVLHTLEHFKRGIIRQYDPEFRLRHKDGSYRSILAQGSLLTDDQGTPIRILGSHIDVTERKRLEQQFFQAQKMESVGRLAGGVAHDFNNLLSVIIGYSDFALDSLPEGDPLRDEILQIRRAGDSAAALTRQLLAFSRSQVLQVAVLDLGQLVKDVEKMLRRLIGEDVKLAVASSDELGYVKVDPGQIEQVIMNLVLNARDAMPQGGMLTIEMRNTELDESYAALHESVTPGAYVMLSVSDTGEGMDETTMGRIFDPFFTTKELGKGTGLGLATVYGIVKQSGGYIYVYSEIGKGTTFKLYFPRVEKEVRPVRLPQAKSVARGVETILVVEDEPSLLLLTQRILAGAGFEVLAVANGGEALLSIERRDGPVHLLLTDVVMPGMSGPELAARLAESQPDLKVLYMSGYTGDTIVRHGALGEGLHFIAKPFTAAQLTGKVREVLDLPGSEDRDR